MTYLVFAERIRWIVNILLINYYLFEKAFDKHRDDPEDGFARL